MRWFRVFRRSLHRRLVDVKYMMYQTDEPEEKKKKEKKIERRRVEGLRTIGRSRKRVKGQEREI